MILRPASTRWFEVLCARADAVRAVAALARTGAVEIEVRPGRQEDFPLHELAQGLEEHERLAAQYGRYWSRSPRYQSAVVTGPADLLERAAARVEAWRGQAEPIIEALQAREEERYRLLTLQQILRHVVGSSLDFTLVSSCGPWLATFCAILPADAEPKLPEMVLARAVPWEEGRCFMVLGPVAEIAVAKRQVAAVKGRIIERPKWLRGTAAAALVDIAARLEALQAEIVVAYAELDTLFDDYSLGQSLGEVEQLSWFAAHVAGLERAGEHFVWITGWTDDLSGRRPAHQLDRSGTRALLRFTPPPAGTRPPQVLDNPRWLRPFELFARLLGIPAADEADPTPLLAVIVPLLFGYMFGDVGQGLVLIVLGALLQRRFEAARLAIAAGASAVVFGFLFGSVFGLEDVIPALWLHPLANPMTVLAVPLGFGVLLLSLGQLLAGLGALWRGDLRRWVAQDLGFLIFYLGLIGLLAGQPSGAVTVLGLLWYGVGAFLVHRRLLGTLAAAGHLLESGLQILVNTLSFARVGAFALAHAALSDAIVTMARVPDSAIAGLLILVLGNAVVIALEGLVVSIQTTRLVLFEFFNRFLRGGGRVFRPLPAPPALIHGEVA
jgi:V/A-type H+-transporting ATPase subunit I